jgi:type II secretory pathway component PulF
MLEPILLILVGFFIVFVALSIIVPIYQFTTDLRLG